MDSSHKKVPDFRLNISSRNADKLALLFVGRTAAYMADIVVIPKFRFGMKNQERGNVKTAGCISRI